MCRFLNGKNHHHMGWNHSTKDGLVGLCSIQTWATMKLYPPLVGILYNPYICFFNFRYVLFYIQQME